jgi:hypothetical protein
VLIDGLVEISLRFELLPVRVPVIQLPEQIELRE